MRTVADHIPVLTTERLTLRAPCRSDFETYAAILMSDRAQYMDGAENRGEAWGAFFHEAGSWIIDNFGYWTAVERDTDTPVGFIGVAHFAALPEVELGWMTTAEHEGKGFAQEGARAARAWAFGSRGLPSLVSYIKPGNARSIALAERLGATRDSNAAGPDPEDIVFRHHGAAQ